MYCPTFEFGNGRIIPHVILPMNFLELVPRFYEQARKQEVIDYVGELNKHLEYCGININVDPVSDILWDEERGLTSIIMRPSGGLDLNEHGWPNFQEHNLGGKRSFIAGAIAMKYVSELWKSCPREIK